MNTGILLLVLAVIVDSLVTMAVGWYLNRAARKHLESVEPVLRAMLAEVMDGLPEPARRLLVVKENAR